MRYLSILAVATITACAIPDCAEAQGRQRIIGRVTTDSARAVPAAQIIVTRGPDRRIFRTTSASDGRFEIVVDSGTGDYLLYAANPDEPTWSAFRKRLTASGPADSVFTVSVVLRVPVAQTLSRVTVRATKPTPGRTDLPQTIGASDQSTAPMVGTVDPTKAGDLNAQMATVPGVTVTTDGISVLGISAQQNSVTLNGMAFPGASLPRNAPVTRRLFTSIFDPSHGWFGGAETGVTIGSGSLFANRSASITFDSPSTLSASNIANGSAPPVGITASIGGSGSTARDRMAYAYGVETGTREGRSLSLESLDPTALTNAGVARDSAIKLLSTWRTLGIPAAGAGGTPYRQSRTSFIARLNTQEEQENSGPSKPLQTSYGVIAFGQRDESTGEGLNILGSRQRALRTVSDAWSLQGFVSRFARPGLLLEGRSALSVNESSRLPALAFPAITVLVPSQLPDGSAALATLAGGGGAGSAHQRALTWETQGEAKFYWREQEAHRIKLNGALRYDELTRTSGANQAGTFEFASLGDLANNLPERYSRSFTAGAPRGGVWNAYASISDLWRISSDLQFLLGLRAEGNVVSTAAAYNAIVDSAFGLRTDRRFTGGALLPRVGFTWNYRGRREGGTSVQGPLGQFFAPYVGVLRGGIGAFRDIARPGMPTTLAEATGLSGSGRSITCVGAAVPVPAWSSYAAGLDAPAYCTGARVTDADSGRRTLVLAAPYELPRSWRANVEWTSHLKRLVWSAELMYALNVNQPSVVELNRRATPSFVAAGEQRPVFVSSATIVPSSGFALASNGRAVGTLGAVERQSSDGRSEARRLIITVTPDLAATGSRYFASLSYVLQSARSLTRGYDGTTFGDPAIRGWQRADFDARHTFTLQAGAVSKYLVASVFGVARSGMPFTPIVSADVNGDGRSNDRAFGFTSGESSDAALLTGLAALRSGGSRPVRDCLAAFEGRAALANSCEGPWTATLNARVALNGAALPGEWRRYTISLFLSNPLSGLDQLLHGSALRGWGSSPAVDPVLYDVAGFDAVAQRYRYRVNPRFGTLSAARSGLQQPFRATLEVSIKLGRPVIEQAVDRWLEPGREGRPGPKLSAAELAERFGSTIPDPYRAILSLSDSLLLTTSQQRELLERRKETGEQVARIWMRMGTELANMPDRFDRAEAKRVEERAADEVWELLRLELQRELTRILDPIQRRLLPYPASFLMAAKGPMGHVRMFDF